VIRRISISLLFMLLDMYSSFTRWIKLTIRVQGSVWVLTFSHNLSLSVILFFGRRSYSFRGKICINILHKGIMFFVLSSLLRVLPLVWDFYKTFLLLGQILLRHNSLLRLVANKLLNSPRSFPHSFRKSHN